MFANYIYQFIKQKCQDAFVCFLGKEKDEFFCRYEVKAMFYYFLYDHHLILFILSSRQGPLRGGEATKASRIQGHTDHKQTVIFS